MSGTIVAVVAGGGVIAGMVAIGRWLGSDKQVMRDARDAHNAQRYRKGDHDGPNHGNVM